MSFTPRGQHLIAGEWTGSGESFSSLPLNGDAHRFAAGSADLVDRAAQAAEDAFWSFGYSSRDARAEFLENIAEEIEARGTVISEIAGAETGLPHARLEGERGRTTGQLRLFADHIRRGDYLDRRYDPAMPDRSPLPRPALHLIQRPIGPVAVFGASNFPLAFSTAGGDTASALAAGCPVIVKGHEAHPGTSEIVAEAIQAAAERCAMPPGVFSLVQGNSHAVGAALVQHPLVRAVGFTGSLAGGRALFNLCMARPEPIPFFGELGSTNPMFLLPAALSERAADIGTGWAGSLTVGAGQFCTNPGVAVVMEGAASQVFVSAAREALEQYVPEPMLTEGIAGAYRNGQNRLAATAGVREVLATQCDARHGPPHLYETAGAHWLANGELSEEVFGPLGLIVRVADEDEMERVARALRGQLTVTLHMDTADSALAARLMPALERKAGRILVNGFPTGVEVADAMVHGGPYPASTNFGATSVGTLAIRRFLRPVSYQNFPEDLLPSDLRSQE